MHCLAGGMKHKGTAKRLGVCSATVHAHLATIYKELDAHDRREARRIFLRLYLQITSCHPQPSCSWPS